MQKIINYKFVIDIIDHFWKWYYGYPLRSKEADEVLIKIKSYVESFGAPAILQADNRLEFKNHKLKNSCIERKIKLLIHSSPRYPQTNGVMEVVHKEITKYMINDYLNDVEKYNIENSLLNIIYIHNNKVHSTTKRIPKDIKD